MKPGPHVISEAVRVFLVAEHALIRAGLRLLVESRGRSQVVGQAANWREALSAVPGARPDVIVVEFEPSGDGGGFLRQLQGAAPAARLLLLAGARCPVAHCQAVRGGAVGVVCKDDPPETLLKAIEKVHGGEVWLDRKTMARVVQGLPREDAARRDGIGYGNGLTEREREVVALVGEALNNKQIGRRLYISETTVRHHLTSIFGKVGVSSRLELMSYAYRYGLARLPDPPGAAAGSPGHAEDSASTRL